MKTLNHIPTVAEFRELVIEKGLADNPTVTNDPAVGEVVQFTMNLNDIEVTVKFCSSSTSMMATVTSPDFIPAYHIHVSEIIGIGNRVHLHIWDEHFMSCGKDIYSSNVFILDPIGVYNTMMGAIKDIASGKIRA